MEPEGLLEGHHIRLAFGQAVVVGLGVDDLAVAVEVDGV